MQTTQYVKSFSKGQITIPQNIRTKLNMGYDFWLKLSIDEGKIIAEPVESEIDKSTWRKKLLQMKPVMLDARELKNNRDEVEKQVNARSI